MAPKSKHKKGKAIDQSTEWSDWAWDEHSRCWAASRIGPDGKPEYDYRDPEETQTSEHSVATPRFAGPSIVTTPNYYSITTTSNLGQYATESESAYTTDPLPSSEQSSPQTSQDHTRQTYYENDKSTDSKYVECQSGSYEEGSSERLRPPSASSATSSVSTIKFSATATAPTVSSSTLRQPYTSAHQNEDYDYEENTSQAFQGLSVSTSSTPWTTTASSSYHQREWNFAEPSTGPVIAAPLNPRYKEVSQKKQKSFWKTGRVFLVLWTEPARTGAFPAGAHFSNSSIVDTIYGGKAFTEIRRFVIVQEGYGSSICCPIHTYQGQATLKHNLPEARQHAIIYTSDYPPNEFWYTATDGSVVMEDLNKDPIKVRREEQGQEGDLGEASRINYSKVYTIEHYVKVLNIGMVEDNWLATLSRNSFVRRDEPPERPRNYPSRSSRSDEKKHDKHDKHDRHDRHDKHDHKGKSKGGNKERRDR